MKGVINMEKDCIRYLTINCNSVEAKKELGTKIHNQLVGNKDYIDSNIVLNIDEQYTVQLWFFKECESIPEITI